MKKFNLNVIALAISIAFSTVAVAQNMSKDVYKASKDKISTEYNVDRAACNSFSDNKKDICVAEAKGKEKVAKAELEASYEPTSKHHYKVRIAKADATYGVAIERCDDLAGNAKDVCVKEAKAAKTAAKADAKVQLKTKDANKTAEGKAADARGDANVKVNDARKDAAADKSDAQYAVEKTKCDKFAGGAKDNCLLDVNTRFGKKQ